MTARGTQGLDREVLLRLDGVILPGTLTVPAAAVGVVVVPGATHLFDEPGALEGVARLARARFVRHLAPGQ